MLCPRVNAGEFANLVYILKQTVFQQFTQPRTSLTYILSENVMSIQCERAKATLDTTIAVRVVLLTAIQVFVVDFGITRRSI